MRRVAIDLKLHIDGRVTEQLGLVDGVAFLILAICSIIFFLLKARAAGRRRGEWFFWWPVGSRCAVKLAPEHWSALRPGRIVRRNLCGTCGGEGMCGLIGIFWNLCGLQLWLCQEVVWRLFVMWRLGLEPGGWAKVLLYWRACALSPVCPSHFSIAVSDAEIRALFPYQFSTLRYWFGRICGVDPGCIQMSMLGCISWCMPYPKLALSSMIIMIIPWRVLFWSPMEAK